jgi:hypothetical protein
VLHKSTSRTVSRAIYWGPEYPLHTRRHAQAQALSAISNKWSCLQCAVDYSRAAYGYAFLAGGLSSVFAYIHMQTVQRSYYDMISGSSVDANNQAAATVAGIPVHDILHAEWRNSTYRYACRCRADFSTSS